MKKFLALILSLALVLGLSACGTTTESNISDVASEPTVEPTAEPTPEPASAELLLGQASSKDGFYSFTLAGAGFGEQITEKHGNSKQIYISQENYLFYLKLRYTNNAATVFSQSEESRITDIRLSVEDNGEYIGKVWVISGDIAALNTAYVYLVFEIPQELEASSEAMNVSFTADGDLYCVSVRDENGHSKLLPANNISAMWLALGELVAENPKGSFTIEKIYFTEKISEKHGNVTNSIGGGDNKYYLVLVLDFTNLNREAFDSWSSTRVTDMTLTYRDNYLYEGECRTLSGDIAPLASGKVYIYYDVPALMENDTESLIAAFTLDGTQYLVDCRQ